MDKTTTPLQDRLRRAAIQRAYDAGDIALGQKLQREAGKAAGGTPESGGAIKRPPSR